LAFQTEFFGTPIQSFLKLYNNGAVPGKNRVAGGEFDS